MNPVSQRNRTSVVTKTGPGKKRIVPFDQLLTFELTGTPNNVLTEVTNISIEGNFAAVAISYSVLPKTPIVFGPVPPAVTGQRIELKDLSIENLLDGFRRALGKISNEKQEVRERQLLQTGFQLNPEFQDFVNKDGRNFDLSNMSSNALSRLFQSISCQQQDVNFLYSIHDNSTGRDFQSEPIHNIAGLGIADGDRPFRFFPYPIIFTPRSVIQIQITEISGIGRLYIVLHGYKVLGTGRELME